ncbi:MAG: hypothetical protein AB8B65_11800 [Kordia sp.]|uniref:hypothetical protein n=1 Tax=Kordia sp. TaxID=1965332 RepID=UPI003859D030
MKKRNINKLTLNKKSISRLNASFVVGGVEAGAVAAKLTYNRILCFTNTSRICPSEEYCHTSQGATACVGLISACNDCPDPIGI